jgi:16S rRNA (guanine527-N7)-methyltransferase
MIGKTSRELLNEYFPTVDAKKVDKLLQLKPLYVEWNDKINVVSRKDIESIFERHILHGLFIAKYTSFVSGSRVLDLGTGGGLPGIPLAILFPDVNFKLIDARAKKLKVIDDICQRLEISNVETQHVRAEDLNEKFDFVVSRAVASSETLVKWSSRLISSKEINSIPNGLICLKGGSLAEELKPLKKRYYIEQVPIADYYRDEYYAEKYILYIQLP